MRKKIKVYLCDCVHNYLGIGTHMFPLNIGYVAAYAKKHFPKEIDIKLFKYPEDFIRQIKKTPPDIVGLSNYAWSADLNNQLSRWIKSISPKIITIFGGPNINYSSQGYKRFFATHDSADFYTPYEGEVPFVNLLKEIVDKGLDLSLLKQRVIDGVVFYDKNNDLVFQDRPIPRIENLDEIPSPYLTGILDEFFDAPLIPIMETNRGCPYTCTFCAQGMSSHNRVNFFNLERVKEDISYIMHRMKNTNMLTFADANFGIAERDIEIAEFVAKLKKETNRFCKLNINLAKNQPKLFEIAKILTDCNMAISLQSLDKTVLKNIKRTNIKLSVFKDIIDKINAIGGISGTEIIVGLPGETKESHFQTIRQLFDWDVSYINSYNIIILEGTEMSLDKESGRFKGTTKFRLIDHSFGKYDNIVSFEVEEGTRSVSTMSEEDILFFRPVHWLIQFLWNYRFYFDLLKYLQSLGINPLDFIVRLIEDIDSISGLKKIKEIFDEFKEEADKEWFDSPETLRGYYSRPEQFKLLKEGRSGGKMNGKYIFRLLLEAKEDFEEYMFRTVVNCAPVCQSKKPAFRNMLDFLSASIVDFNRSWDEICKEKTISCKYDFLEWRSSRYKKNLEEFYRPEGISYHLYLPEEQKRSIDMLLKQYKNECKNVALRKMSEYMDFRDFTYKLKSAEGHN